MAESNAEGEASSKRFGLGGAGLCEGRQEQPRGLQPVRWSRSWEAAPGRRIQVLGVWVWETGLPETKRKGREAA